MYSRDRGREREYVCVCESEMKSVCASVKEEFACVRERERPISVMYSERGRERERVCVRERERNLFPLCIVGKSTHSGCPNSFPMSG